MSITLDKSICKTKVHCHNNYPPHPERLWSARPNAHSDWSNSWLPGEKTQDYPGGLCCCLWAVAMLYFSEQMHQQRLLLGSGLQHLCPPQCALVFWHYDWHSELGWATSCWSGTDSTLAISVKGLKSVSAKLFKKLPQLQQSSVLHDRK